MGRGGIPLFYCTLRRMETARSRLQDVYKRQYYGCTLCQLDIREYANAYDRIKAKDAQLLVVLQSPASTINAQMKKEDLPFDIICDPDMGLYKEFELGVAASKEEMIRPEDMPKMGEKRAKMEEYGLSHGAYEGEEMQFPGYFLLDSELNVLEAHRATDVYKRQARTPRSPL